MLRHVVMMGAGLVLTGCASITSDSTQLIRVDALDEAGDVVRDASCDLTNNKGVYQTETGKHVMVRKSGEDLLIRCTSDSQTEPAEGRAISRVGPGMFGNIIFGGGVGAIIDHTSGTAYRYPEWMQVVFGKMYVFDRANYEDGVPLRGQLTAPNLVNAVPTEDAGKATE